MPLDPSLVSAPQPDNANIRLCSWAGDFDPTRTDQKKPALSSLRALFRRSAEENPKSPCLGWRPSPTVAFEWMTYERVATHVDAWRAALQAAGLEKGDCVGIYARNCPQWVIAQYAIMSAGLVAVPIYDTLGPNIIEYVCNHADVKAVFVSTLNFGKLDSVRTAEKIPSVTKVIVMGEKDICQDDSIDECVTTSDAVSVSDFNDSGNEVVSSGTYVEPELSLDDMLVIMYTSGTTGNPKGVVLTHRNLIASVASAYLFFKQWDYDYSPSDSLLSYLPLSHIFEQQAEAMLIGCGGRIGYYTGDIKLLLSDMEALQPSVFIGVPRVFARFQQRIEENIESASLIKRMLFNWGLSRQTRAVESAGDVIRSGLWDSLIFNKVRDRLLPKGRLIITGSAPMSAQTNTFLKVCLNCPVAQGYGLTETVGGMNCSVPGKSASGTVGGPLPGVEVKLSDLPDMGYLGTDKPFPRGEVCVRGDVVFQKYLHNDVATTAAFDADGFFKTGDVGQWMADGSLQIIDRAKNLFKLSQGEYVSPEQLEQEYGKAKLVGQIFIYGNSLHDRVVGVVVPDVTCAKEWGERRDMQSLDSIAASDDFKKELLEQLEEMRAKSALKKYEAVQDVIVEVSDLNDLGQGFTVDNDLMTPSFKLKRPQLKGKYGERLDALYEK